MVVYTYNPAYVGGRNWKITVWTQLGQKELLRSHLNK
jgi:hypothetical protein